MNTLDKIQAEMTKLGWQNGGQPDDAKMRDGKIVARHGSGEWLQDIDTCCDRVESAAALAELERRMLLTGN